MQSRKAKAAVTAVVAILLTAGLGKLAAALGLDLELTDMEISAIAATIVGVAWAYISGVAQEDAAQISARTHRSQADQTSDPPQS